jgi:tight adherence protein C
MTAALVGFAWTVVVIGGAVRHLPPRRLRQLAPVTRVRPARMPTVVVGQMVFRLARRPSDDVVATRRLGRAVIAFLLPFAVLARPLATTVAVAAGGTMWLLPLVDERRRAARRRAQLEDELPEVVDLLVLAVGAGLTVPLAIDAVARHGGGALAGELGAALAASRTGHRLADALDALPARAGETVRPLVGPLVAAERYGAPIVAGLERLALDVRAARRRRADEAARKVSVKLLFPLVLCILPAFALLTVAPLIASALRSLRL